MLRRITFGLATLAVAGFGLPAVGKEMPDTGERGLQQKLESLLSAHQLPGMAAAAWVDGKITRAAAAGVRRLGKGEPVTLKDQWHIGSCGKAITASVTAMLVEEGALKWDTTLGEIFAAERRTMKGTWPEVTVEQLLQHTSGAPSDPPAALWQEAWDGRGSPTEQRLRFSRGLWQTAPGSQPGAKFAYSNQGYAVLGSIIEKLTGRAWENLVNEKFFSAMGMGSAGFGAPGTSGKLDQPYGHAGPMGKLKPMPPGPAADNPPAIAPAGTMHCSIEDFARFAGWHAQEGRGDSGVRLKPETFRKIHTPQPGQTYAPGWEVTQRKWAGGPALMHAGSNTMWYALVWIAPQKNAAFVAATNAAHENAHAACDEAIAFLIGESLPAGSP